MCAAALAGSHGRPTEPRSSRVVAPVGCQADQRRGRGCARDGTPTLPRRPSVVLSMHSWCGAAAGRHTRARAVVQHPRPAEAAGGVGAAAGADAGGAPLPPHFCQARGPARSQQQHAVRPGFVVHCVWLMCGCSAANMSWQQTDERTDRQACGWLQNEPVVNVCDASQAWLQPALASRDQLTLATLATLP